MESELATSSGKKPNKYKEQTIKLQTALQLKARELEAVQRENEELRRRFAQSQQQAALRHAGTAPQGNAEVNEGTAAPASLVPKAQRHTSPAPLAPQTQQQLVAVHGEGPSPPGAPRGPRRGSQGPHGSVPTVQLMQNMTQLLNQALDEASAAVEPRLQSLDTRLGTLDTRLDTLEARAEDGLTNLTNPRQLDAVATALLPTVVDAVVARVEERQEAKIAVNGERMQALEDETNSLRQELARDRQHFAAQLLQQRRELDAHKQQMQVEQAKQQQMQTFLHGMAQLFQQCFPAVPSTAHAAGAQAGRPAPLPQPHARPIMPHLGLSVQPNVQQNAQQQQPLPTVQPQEGRGPLRAPSGPAGHVPQQQGPQGAAQGLRGPLGSPKRPLAQPQQGSAELAEVNADADRSAKRHKTAATVHAPAGSVENNGQQPDAGATTATAAASAGNAENAGNRANSVPGNGPQQAFGGDKQAAGAQVLDVLHVGVAQRQTSAAAATSGDLLAEFAAGPLGAPAGAPQGPTLQAADGLQQEQQQDSMDMSETDSGSKDSPESSNTGQPTEQDQQQMEGRTDTDSQVVNEAREHIAAGVEKGLDELVHTLLGTEWEHAASLGTALSMMLSDGHLTPESLLTDYMEHVAAFSTEDALSEETLVEMQELSKDKQGGALHEQSPKLLSCLLTGGETTLSHIERISHSIATALKTVPNTVPLVLQQLAHLTTSVHHHETEHAQHSDVSNEEEDPSGGPSGGPAEASQDDLPQICVQVAALALLLQGMGCVQLLRGGLREILISDDLPKERAFYTATAVLDAVPAVLGFIPAGSHTGKPSKAFVAAQAQRGLLPFAMTEVIVCMACEWDPRGPPKAPKGKSKGKADGQTDSPQETSSHANGQPDGHTSAKPQPGSGQKGKKRVVGFSELPPSTSEAVQRLLQHAAVRMAVLGEALWGGRVARLSTRQVAKKVAKQMQKQLEQLSQLSGEALRNAWSDVYASVPIMARCCERAILAEEMRTGIPGALLQLADESKHVGYALWVMTAVVTCISNPWAGRTDKRSKPNIKVEQWQTYQAAMQSLATNLHRYMGTVLHPERCRCGDPSSTCIEWLLASSVDELLTSAEKAMTAQVVPRSLVGSFKGTCQELQKWVAVVQREGETGMEEGQAEYEDI